MRLIRALFGPCWETRLVPLDPVVVTEQWEPWQVVSMPVAGQRSPASILVVRRRLGLVSRLRLWAQGAADEADDADSTEGGGGVP